MNSKRFAVFDFVDAARKHDAVFGDVGRWLVKYLQADVRSHCTPEKLALGLHGLQGQHWPSRPFNYFQGPKGECEGVLCALMKSLHVSEFIQQCIENELTMYNFSQGRRDRPPTGDKVHVNYLRPRRSVRVVLFGVFTGERIDMPRKPAGNAKLLAHSAVDEFWDDPCTFPDCIDIASNLADNFKLNFLPNHYRDDPVPPPPLQFYAYLLREHFDMQFGDTVFSMRPGMGGHTLTSSGTAGSLETQSRGLSRASVWRLSRSI
jgi:hypothetical protein